MKYTKEWMSLTERIGYWVDMNDPYITYDNRYIDALCAQVLTESVHYVLLREEDVNALEGGVQPHDAGRHALVHVQGTFH